MKTRRYARKPMMHNDFDLCEAITEYLTDHGIVCDVTVDFDRNDPDYPTYDLNVDWYEDDDRQSFVVRNAQHFNLETLYDLWVRDREAQHAHYLDWLATEGKEVYA